MNKINTYDPSTHIAVEKRSAAIMARAAEGQLRLQQTSLRAHLTRVAGYLGIGALVHAWFLGPDFDAGSLWSWGYVAMWPVPLAFWFVMQAAVFGFYLLMLMVGCSLLWAGLCLAGDLHRRRRERREAAARWKPTITDPRD